jgi:phosphomannomutase
LRAKIVDNSPLAFADHEVESWWDATRGNGSGSRIASGPALPVTPDCNHIMFWTRQGAIVSIRASGTEPKIKVHGFGNW